MAPRGPVGPIVRTTTTLMSAPAAAPFRDPGPAVDMQQSAPEGFVCMYARTHTFGRVRRCREPLQRALHTHTGFTPFNLDIQHLFSIGSIWTCSEGEGGGTRQTNKEQTYVVLSRNTAPSLFLPSLYPIGLERWVLRARRQHNTTCPTAKQPVTPVVLGGRECVYATATAVNRPRLWLVEREFLGTGSSQKGLLYALNIFTQRSTHPWEDARP